MCLNQGRPGMPSGLSQLRSTCIMPWLRVRASLGSMGAESFIFRDSFSFFPADSKLSIDFLTAVRSRPVGGVGEPETKPWCKLPLGPQVAQADTGSFDCVAASLR